MVQRAPQTAAYELYNVINLKLYKDLNVLSISDNGP